MPLKRVWKLVQLEQNAAARIADWRWQERSYNNPSLGSAALAANYFPNWIQGAGSGLEWSTAEMSNAWPTVRFRAPGKRGGYVIFLGVCLTQFAGTATWMEILGLAS